MASPHSERFAITPSSGKGLLSTPGSRVFQTHLSDDVISRRLKEAGFDEESVKRRDKAALIAYIAKLEAEIYDHQYQMGLLLLEKKELISNGEKLKASSEATELQYRRDQAAHASALAEVKKREESLKKALGVERQCLTSIEKALHEMRAESAEIKVAAESKIVEARSMIEDAQKKCDEAERKWRAAESLETEASRFRHFAERKIQEVEEREDDLRRRILSFHTDCDLKENEILLERKSLAERQRVLHEGESRLTEGQALLNQREEYILTRSQDLIQSEKELESAKSDLEKQRRSLIDEKSDLDLKAVSLSAREEGCIKKEALLNKKEQEILILQEKLSSRESVDIQKVVASREVAWKLRESEFEAELEEKRKMVEKEIETKQRAWELRELDLKQLEDQFRDREHDLESQLRSLTEREKDVLERSNDIDRREKCFAAAEQDFEQKSKQFQKEKEEFYSSKLDIEKSQDLLKNEKKQIDGTKDELQAMKSEINELSVLEIKLKEELDSVRAEKLEILAEAEKMKDEKAKFEAEWESIDEKREELRREAERVAEERLAVAKLLKEERDNLRAEKDALRNQYKNDAESLRVEREEFMNRISRERSELFSKFQEERVNLLLEIEMQKKEVENCIQKKHEELESSLREKESSFEQKKNNELQRIKILEERVQKELEQAAAEMRRLEKERIEINLDRERRDREWLELSNSIEELKLQSEKLKEQRQLLHADREEIHDRIEYLKKLEDSHMASEQMAIAAIQQSALESSMQRISQKTPRGIHVDFDDNTRRGIEALALQERTNGSPSITPASWLKRAADLIFSKSPSTYKDKSQMPENGDGIVSRGSLVEGYGLHNNGNQERTGKADGTFSKKQLVPTLGEEKMIFEVPTLGEDITVTHTMEAEVRVDASDKAGESIYNERLQPGRKRRGRELQSDSVDALPETRQNKNKRGKVDEAAVNILDKSNADWVNPGQADTVDHVHASQSSCNDAQVVEETKISGSAQQAKDAIQTEWVEEEILHMQMAVGLVTDQAGGVCRSDDPKVGDEGNID